MSSDIICPLVSLVGSAVVQYLASQTIRRSLRLSAIPAGVKGEHMLEQHNIPSAVNISNSIAFFINYTISNSLS